MVPSIESEPLLIAPPSRREAARRATERLHRRRRQRAQRRREAAVSAAGPERRDVLESLIGDTQTESSTAATRLRSLAASVSVVDPADVVDVDGRDPEVWEHELLQVALALRITRAQAQARIRRARRAVEQLPGCLERLACADMPLPWFEMIEQRTRMLDVDATHEVDAALAASDLHVSPEVFARRLRYVIAAARARSAPPECATPRGKRRVVLDQRTDEGTACLRVIGPIPELLHLSRQLDTAAHTLQDAQREALRDGEVIPGDPRGDVAATGEPASLGALRYEALCDAVSGRGSGAVANGAAQSRRERFRIVVTVPVLTLLGESDAPGTLDGTTPIPPQLARELAAQEPTWYRVLTDPASGAFAPLPADRYTPTPAMLEHLRLRHPICAVPGCTRPTALLSECDHIEEFDHQHPARGGGTELENLHLLCRHHHRAKTAGLLDPIRSDEGDGTWWSIDDEITAYYEDERDLATPQMVRDLEAAHAMHEAELAERRRTAARLRLIRSGDLAPGMLLRGPDGNGDWVLRDDGRLDKLSIPLPCDPPPF